MTDNQLSHGAFILHEHQLKYEHLQEVHSSCSARSGPGKDLSGVVYSYWPAIIMCYSELQGQKGSQLFTIVGREEGGVLIVRCSASPI